MDSCLHRCLHKDAGSRIHRALWHNWCLNISSVIWNICTWSIGAWTSSWKPFRLHDFDLQALQALRPCELDTYDAHDHRLDRCVCTLYGIKWQISFAISVKSPRESLAHWSVEDKHCPFFWVYGFWQIELQETCLPPWLLHCCLAKKLWHSSSC